MRVFEMSQRWMSLVNLATPAGRSPVEAAMRVTCPAPLGITSAAFRGENAAWSPSPSTSCVDHTPPSWASFSSRLISETIVSTSSDAACSLNRVDMATA